MGNKTKVGKRRRDRFYRLAKETGYRSRSAFKLLQLNRKWNFLQQSRVVLDLCAAPGGWLQVAAEHTPLSSVIIGVDLVAIKPIHNIVTIQADITSEKCRQLVHRELKGLKADCVLHDGSPNVGAAWIQDAFSQALLCLKALKLACEFLASNGFFITKVFRSRDYQPLMWVLQQLFKRVHATKPQASRSESAEIFVVCQGYLAPDKIDPLMLDPKTIFKEVEVAQKRQLFQQENKKSKAEGYEEREETQFKSFKMSEFVTGNNFLEILSSASELVFDVDVLLKHPLTTDELKECCKDIKVLGKREIKNILAWRVKMRNFLECPQQGKERSESEAPSDENEPENRNSVEEIVSLLESDAAAEAKQKQRRTQKKRQKLQERMRLKMGILSGDPGVSSEEKLFSLSGIKSVKAVQDVDCSDMTFMDHSGEDGCLVQDKSDNWSRSSVSDDETSSDDARWRTAATYEEGSSNPLLIQFNHSDHSAAASHWFNKDVFKGLEDEDDEDPEISSMTRVDAINGTGKTAVSDNRAKKQTILDEKDKHSSEDGNEEMQQLSTKKKKKKTDRTNVIENSTYFTSTDSVFGQKLKPLDAVGLAIGTRLATSKKVKQELEDESYHRWAFNDANLPDWLVEDEQKHYRRQLPVTKELVEEYKMHRKEINARPIKKVAEAKARKMKLRLRQLKRLEKKAESLETNLDVSEKERLQQIQKLYKKLKKEPKKEVTYVVAKKSLVGKKARRPAGVKGRYRMVDPRMKKDTRSQKTKDSGKNHFRKRRSAFR